MTKIALLAVSLLVYSGIDCGSESRYGGSVYSSAPSGKQSSINPGSPSLSTITSSRASSDNDEDNENADAQVALLKNNESQNSEQKSASPAPASLAVAAEDTILADAQLREHQNNGETVLQEVAEQKGVVVDDKPCASAIERCRQGYRSKSDSALCVKQQSGDNPSMPRLVPLSQRLREQQCIALAAQGYTQSPAAHWCFCL